MNDERTTFPSGMQRDTASDKIRWDLIWDGPMLERYAKLLTKGAAHYAPRNWMLANSAEEMDRARQSLARHFASYMAGEVEEDHAAACVFNINLIEYIKTRIPVVEFKGPLWSEYHKPGRIING